MKILHLSDLHLGKRLAEYNLFDEQRDILQKILHIADEERPDCVILAGDLYNRAVPQEEAVQILDEFLFRLAERKLPVLVISGNHDSAERIAFGGRILGRGGVHMAPVYSGQITPITLEDAHGPVHFYLLPFVKPVHVRRFFPEAHISSYNDAVRTAVDAMAIDPDARNVLVTHQFITGAALSSSEEIMVGGTDNVDADTVAAFDYVALGHIHRPQTIAGHIRYCGTPLVYSLSEIGQQKSVTIAELGEKGSLDIRTVPLTPMRQVRELKGRFDQLSDPAFYKNIDLDDYISIVLTDEQNIPEAGKKLSKIYTRMLRCIYDNSRTQAVSVVDAAAAPPELLPDELVAQFFMQQHNHGMTEQQNLYLKNIIREIWEEDI